MSEIVTTRRLAGPPPIRPPGGGLGVDAAVDGPPARSDDAGEVDGGAVLDPRMVARRVAVRRDEGRRRLHRLAGAGAAAAVVVAAALSTRTPLLDLDHVEIRGMGASPTETDTVTDTAIDTDAVIEVVSGAGAARGTPLLDVDPGRVERAVESVPAIATAHVSREWPGTLVVQVSPRVPVAVVGGALVAADGVVVAVTPAGEVSPITTTLVALDDVAIPTTAGDRVDAPDLLTVAALLPAEVRAAVAAVRAGPAEGEVDLRLTGGGIARLGPTTGLGSKLVAVATVLEQVDLTCLATIDARVPSAPAVTRTPGC